MTTRFPAAYHSSLTDVAVLQQAASANVHSGLATEFGTTYYAPTCGKGPKQGSCGIHNSASDQGQPTYAPRTMTQNLIFFMFARSIEESQL